MVQTSLKENREFCKAHKGLKISCTSLPRCGSKILHPYRELQAIWELIVLSLHLCMLDQANWWYRKQIKNYEMSRNIEGIKRNSYHVGSRARLSLLDFVPGERCFAAPQTETNPAG
jgi:hypothetical protein